MVRDGRIFESVRKSKEALVAAHRLPCSGRNLSMQFCICLCDEARKPGDQELRGELGWVMSGMGEHPEGRTLWPHQGQ